ncbi:MAG: diguanylate cyclase, partial [Burkholderiales bacterium]|nr:diguanylate cyclase [Burkholderiales bacterium]
MWFVLVLLVGGVAVGVTQLTAERVQPLKVVQRTDYLEDPAGITVEAALNQLRSTALGSAESSSLHPRGPFWMRMEVGDLPKQSIVAELRLLRLSSGQFWIVTKSETGAAIASEENLIPIKYRVAKGGTALDISMPYAGKLEILAKVVPTSMSRPKAFFWRAADFGVSGPLFERGGGALGGSLIILALFSAIIATLNRDRVFWLFSGWLITSLRVASVNNGWDAVWLGVENNLGAIEIILLATLSLHALLTVELFRALFEQQLKPRLLQLFSVLRMLCISLTVMAFFLHTETFLPILWGVSVVGILVLFWSLAYVLRSNRSSVAIWYTLSWGFTFAGLLAEVAFVAGLSSKPSGILNAQVGAVASALLTAIALAERLRREKTRRLAAQTQAVGALRQYRDNYNSLPIGLFALDEFGAFSGYNPAFAEMLGLPPFSNSGPRLTWSTLFGRESLEDLEISLRGKRVSDLEIFRPASEGEGNWYLVRATHKAVGIEGSFQDVTARKLAEHQFKHLADHDPLTDLLNLRGLSGEINKTIDKVEDGAQSSLAFVDLDRFKLVNDLFGHFAGDQVLIQIAQRLRNRFDTPHVLGRMGGDEFVIVLNDCSPVAAKVQCEEVLREIIEHPYHVGDKAFAVTCSIGLTEFQSGMSERDVLAACDRACAEAKSHGGSQVIVYAADDASMVEQLDEIRLISLIRQKLPVERLFTVMQPIVSLTAPFSNLNYKVLLRMRDADGSVILPGRFVAAAERNGLMADIDRWVLNT